MKIEQASPNTIHLKFRQEKDDENYGNCLWGDVIMITPLQRKRTAAIICTVGLLRLTKKASFICLAGLRANILLEKFLSKTYLILRKARGKRMKSYAKVETVEKMPNG